MENNPTYWQEIVQPTGETDERCFFEIVDPRERPVIHCLTIEESSSATGELISRVQTRVFVNDAGEHLIATHPIWSKDRRLFLLNQIYDAFMELKLVAAQFTEPHSTKLGLRDSKSGAITYVEVLAEVFFDTGSPFIPVVNYCNVHIPDQIREIIRLRPESAPQQEIVQSRVSAILGLREAEAELQEARRNDAFKALPSSAGRATFFIDETGDLSFKEAESFYGISGVSIPDENLDGVRAGLTEILGRHWKGSKPERIHFTKLAGNPAKLERVAKELSGIFTANVSEAFVFAAGNLNFLKYLLRCEAALNKWEERPVRTDFGVLLAEPENRVNRKRLVLTNEEIVTHVALECLGKGLDLSIIHDRKNVPWMNEALEAGFERAREAVKAASLSRYGQPLCPDMDFKTTPSKDEPCLWLSDWLAWEVGNWVRRGNLTAGFEAVQESLSIFSYGEQGEKLQVRRLGEEPVGRYPDLPREIASII